MKIKSGELEAELPAQIARTVTYNATRKGNILVLPEKFLKIEGMPEIRDD